MRHKFNRLFAVSSFGVVGQVLPTALGRHCRRRWAGVADGGEWGLPTAVGRDCRRPMADIADRGEWVLPTAYERGFLQLIKEDCPCCTD